MFLSEASISYYFHGSLCSNTSEPSPCLHRFEECLSHFTVEVLSDSLLQSAACGQEANK